MQKTLPKGWKWVRLGEVCELFNGKTPSEKEKRSQGSPVLKIKDIDGRSCFVGNFDSFIDEEFFKKYSNKTVRDGDTLLLNAAHNADYVGSKSFFVSNMPDNLIATGEWLIIRGKSINDKFKHYWITANFNRPQIRELVKGIHLYPKDMFHFKIPLPPLPTQHKIVEILEEADNLRKLRKQADDKMKDLIPSLFVQMFGDPAKNPKRWKIVELYEAATFKRGPFGGSLKKEIFINSGYKVYEQRNAIYNNFTIGSYYIDEEKYKAMLPFAIQPDDLIVSCSGTMGKVAIVPQNAQKGIINQALLKITPKKHMTASLYLKFLIESNSIQSTYFKNAAGSAIQNVTSVSALKKIKIPLPPLPLQQEFTKIVEDIEAEKARQTESRKKLNELFNSLMQRAFIGELVA